MVTNEARIFKKFTEKAEKYISKFNELSEIETVGIGEIIKKDNFTIYLY